MATTQLIDTPKLPASIVQSNRLIEARCSLTLIEQRVVLAMISQVKREDDKLNEIKINISDLAQLAGLDPSSLYREVKQATRDLLSKPLVIEEEAGELHINWISSAQYLDATGAVLLSFDQKLKPYLVKLRSQFTTISTTAIKLTGQYSIRIYMLLKQYERIGKRRFTVEDFRLKLGITPNEYKTYYDLKRRTILFAQAEFAKTEHIDIEFDFIEEKEARKVTAIVFRIFKKETQDALDLGDPTSILEDDLTDDDLPPEDWDAIEREKVDASLKRYGLKAGKIKSLRSTHTNESLAEAIVVYEQALKKGMVKNKGGGYLLSLIEAEATSSPSGVIQLEIDKERKKRITEEAAAKRKSQQEEIEAKSKAKLTQEHLLNLDWVNALPGDEVEKALSDVAKSIPSPKMRAAFKNQWEESLSSPATKSIFDTVIGQLRASSTTARPR